MTTLKRFLALTAVGLVGALGFTLGAVVPLLMALSVALMVCAVMIGTAVLLDQRDIRRGVSVS